jgi:phosphatidylserine/phosphatidylglycerophosphate/cardiolipin synthase-like enzyme
MTIRPVTLTGLILCVTLALGFPARVHAQDQATQDQSTQDQATQPQPTPDQYIEGQGTQGQATPDTNGANSLLSFFPSGAAYKVAFSPFGNALSLVLHVIASATSTINVAAYELTSRPIADALIVSQSHGVKVLIVADYRCSREPYSRVNYLRARGIPVRLDSQYLIEHNKFAVIDGVGVLTGSFNWTAQAPRNAENSIFITRVPDLAQAYLTEWQRLWNESR